MFAVFDQADFFVIWNCLGHQIWLRWVTKLSFERNIQEIRHMNWREIIRRPKHDHSTGSWVWPGRRAALHLTQQKIVFITSDSFIRFCKFLLLAQKWLINEQFATAYPFPGTPYCLLTLITPLTPALSVTERPSSEAARDKAFHCCKVENWSRLRDISFSGWSLKSWSSE